MLGYIQACRPDVGDGNGDIELSGEDTPVNADEEILGGETPVDADDEIFGV